MQGAAFPAHSARSAYRKRSRRGISAGDIGAAAVTRGLAERLDAWAILQTYSRLVIDCNRRPDVPSSIPVRSENTDIPGNVGLGEADAAARRIEIFEPYHAQITNLLDARAKAGRPVLLLAMHSFTPIYDNAARPMHAGVLYNRDPRLSLALLALCCGEEPGLVVGDNAPYQVSDETDYGVPVHAEPRGIPHVELEVRQDLIADEKGQAEWIERLARLLPLAAEVRKDFFFEKKKQKTFAMWDRGCGNARLKGPKVFWFFFSKKNCFFASFLKQATLAAHRDPPRSHRMRRARARR